MKNGLSLSEMAIELERRAAAKKDFVADTRKLQFVPQPNNGISLQIGDDGSTNFPVNSLAHNQIAQRLQVPQKYYDRMLAEAPDLLAENVNHWFQSNPESRLVRTLDGRARAFLSDRYQRIENEQIASTVLPILMAEPEVRIESCQVTERRLYIKAVFPRLQREVARGDVVQSGIAISNSEVGHGSVRIEPLIFRLVCLNGLIVEDAKYTARHVGGRIGSGDENIVDVLSDEALRADDHAILLKTRDVVKASFDEARFAQHVQAMTASLEDRILGHPAKAVEVLAKIVGFSEFEAGSVLRHLIAGGDVSRYGMLNAVTRTAQDVESYDRATELEQLGGNILYFPKKDWKAVAEAA